MEKDGSIFLIFHKSGPIRGRAANPLCCGVTLKGVAHLFCRSLVLLSLSLLVLSSEVRGQNATPGESQPQAMGGVNTGGTHAPVLDSEKRPITAGGFVKTGPIIFEDIAAKAGLTTWHHTMGTPKKQFILEAPGSGVALLDYDKDGNVVGLEILQASKRIANPRSVEYAVTG